MNTTQPAIRFLAAALLALAVAPTGALAQLAPEFPPGINTEQNARRNVLTSGARAPGTMVNAGVVRTLAAANAAQRIIEITEEPPGPDPKATFLIAAIETVFEQLNRAILLFENVLRARAGLPPRVPIDLPSGTPTETTDTTDGVTDEDVQGILDNLN